MMNRKIKVMKMWGREVKSLLNNVMLELCVLEGYWLIAGLTTKGVAHGNRNQSVAD